MPPRERAQTHAPAPGEALLAGVPVWLVAAALLMGGIAFSAWALALRDFDPEAGLVANTTFLSPPVPDHPFGGRSTWPSNPLDAARAYREAGAALVLWIGASQLHAINAYSEGDSLAVTHANELAREEKLPLAFFQVSRGNSNHHDHLGIYLEYRQAGLAPDFLVLALVYDDLRERGVQRTVVDRIPHFDLDGMPLGADAKAALDVLRAAKTEVDAAGAAPIARSATSGTPQERLEEKLLAGLVTVWPAYGLRDRVTAWLELRTWAASRFLINAVKRTRRQSLGAPRVPEAARRSNERALEALVEIARRDGVELILYRQPHAPNQEPFYHDRAAYDAFYERMVETHGRRRGVVFADLERIVPEAYFGLSNWGLVDVFHFTARGHEILGRAVYRLVREAWERRKGEPVAVQ